MTRKAGNTDVTGEISGAAAITGLAGMIKRVAATGEGEAMTTAVGSIVAVEDGSLVATGGMEE